MKCSKLNDGLLIHKSIDNDLCNCGHIEKAFQYFFECCMCTLLRNDIELGPGIVPILSLNIISNCDALHYLNKGILNFILLCQNIFQKISLMSSWVVT